MKELVDWENSIKLERWAYFDHDDGDEDDDDDDDDDDGNDIIFVIL